MKLDFEYIKKEILASNVKSEYKQSSIMIIRNIFKEAETKKLPIHDVSNNEVALIEPLRNFIRSKHLSSEWESWLKEYERNL